MTVDLAVVGIVCSALLYALGRRRMAGSRHRREGRWRAQAFYAGLAVLVPAVEPPLDGLADRLFWAHMLQHMLLQMGRAAAARARSTVAAHLARVPAR